MTNERQLSEIVEDLRNISHQVRRIHPEVASPMAFEHLKSLVLKLTANCEALLKIFETLQQRMEEFEEELRHVRHYSRRPDSGGNPESD